MTTNTVFTNGCFDLLHVGHVRLLQWARTLGGRLVVGINSDESVRRLKGHGRPVTCQNDRMEILRAIRCVDSVIIFNEDTTLTLIMSVKPAVLVKGPDYHGKKVIGKDFVESIGGRVEIPEWDIDVTTSSILERMQH